MSTALQYFFKKCPNLESLTFYGECLDDDMVLEIAKLNHLQELRILGDDVQFEGKHLNYM